MSQKSGRSFNEVNAGKNKSPLIRVCHYQDACKTDGCSFIHGIWEPKQEARFLKTIALNKDGPVEGIVICAFGYVGSCAHYHDGMCGYRHFTAIHPLTDAQKAIIEGSLVGVGGIKPHHPKPKLLMPKGAAAEAAARVAVKPKTRSVAWARPYATVTGPATRDAKADTEYPPLRPTVKTTSTDDTKDVKTTSAPAVTPKKVTVLNVNEALRVVVKALIGCEGHSIPLHQLREALVPHGIKDWVTDVNCGHPTVFSFVREYPAAFTVDDETATVALSPKASALAHAHLLPASA
jgi:hypothetical protein